MLPISACTVIPAPAGPEPAPVSAASPDPESAPDSSTKFESGAELESSADSELGSESQPKLTLREPPVDLPPSTHVDLIGVPQRPVPPANWWSFSPDSSRVAAFVDDRCELWDVASGAFVASLPGAEDGPCETWPNASAGGTGEGQWAESADGQLLVSIEIGSTITVESADGSSSRTIQADNGGVVLNVALAPSGDQLAVLTDEPLAIEIWDLAHDKLVRSRSLAVPGEQPAGLFAWNEDGIVAVIMTDAPYPCSRDPLDRACHACGELVPTFSTAWWPNGKRDPVVQPAIIRDAASWDMIAAPDLSHVFVPLAACPERSSDDLAWVDLAPMGRPSGLSEPQPSPATPEVDLRVEGYWLEHGTTQWVTTRMREARTETGGTLEWSWSAITAEPSPALLGGIVVDEPLAAGRQGFVEGRVYGATQGRELIRWQAVFDLQGAGSSSSGPDLVGACGIGDDDAASPTLDVLLADCGGQLTLVEPGRGQRGPRVRHQLPVVGHSYHQWGHRGWLALLDPSGQMIVVDPQT
ncbi:MAG TPA: hypothetical protein VK034_18845, partial [Enhygromyxa sp.]|nr:hypothetical protein [Enhygromyxa sp.]